MSLVELLSGSVSDMDNKTFLILLSRLKAGGAEDFIWPTQFGFKSGRGTWDAIFVALRMLEQAWAKKCCKINVYVTWQFAIGSSGAYHLHTHISKSHYHSISAMDKSRPCVASRCR